MNIYHVTRSPLAGTAYLHFWGCNLNCRACLLKKELYDCHLKETRDSIFQPTRRSLTAPDKFLELANVMWILHGMDIKEVIFMGAEPAIDPELPRLAEVLHREFGSYNILLTNGFLLADIKDIDEVVFSIKARTDELHRDYTGKSNKNALKNFLRYHQSGVKLRAESIYIPEYIDSAEIEKIARFIAQVSKSIPYRIDAYIPVGNNPWRRPIPREMEQAVSTACKHLDNVSCLTGNENLKYEVLRVV